MDSFGRPQKFASNRKQELQLQNELKAIRNKALLDRYAKQNAGDVIQSDFQAAYAPRPPSKPNPHLPSRIKIKPSPVPTRDASKPSKVSKLETKGSDKPPKKNTLQSLQKASPLKVVVDASTGVKFGITSAMNTSVPVQQVHREEPKTIFQKSLPKAKKTKPSSQPTTSLVDCVTKSQAESTNIEVFTTTAPLPAPVIVTSRSESDLASSVGLSLSPGSQKHSEEDSDVMDTPKDTFPMESEVQISHTPSAILMLKVDMRFGSEDGHISDDQHSSDTPCVSPSLHSSRSSTERLSNAIESADEMELSGNLSRPSSVEFDPQQTHSLEEATPLPTPSNSSSTPKGSQSKLALSPQTVDSQNEAEVTGRLENESFHFQTDGSSHTKSSSTIKASEDKGSLFYSVGGSLSSFGQPFSMQQSSMRSLSGTSSMEDDYPDSSAQSTAQGFSPLHSVLDVLPQLPSDQNLATSSWLHALNNKGDYDTGSSTSATDKDTVEVVHASESSGSLKHRSSEVKVAVEETGSVQDSVQLSIPSESISFSTEELATQVVNVSVDDTKSLGSEDITSQSTNQDSVCSGQLDQEEQTATESDQAVPSQRDIHEFLAFSDSPVTLEDVLNVTGTKLPDHPTRASPSKDAQPTGFKPPKPLFLSTWDTSVSYPGSTHTSIHHFCTETKLPQLPLPIQLLSRQSHTKGFVSSNTSQDKCEYEGNINAPRSQTTSTNKVTPQRTSASNQHSQKHTAISTSNQPKRLPKSNDIIAMAQARLQRELNITHESSRKKLSPVKIKLPDHNFSNEEFMVSGDAMQIAQDPSNLLWVPAPPKLGLHPSTIQFHLFPQYKTRPLSEETGVSALPSLSVVKTQSEHREESPTDQEERSTAMDDPTPRLLGAKSVPNFATLRAELTSHPSVEDEKSAQTDDQTVDSSSLVELDAKDGLPQKDHVADPTSRPVTMTAASGTVIGHTQSLPQLPPARPRAESRVGRASEEFNALMKEVELQREKLIQYYKDRDAPKLDNTSPADECNPLEETQTFEESTLASSAAFTSRKLQRQFMKGTKRGTGKGGTTGRVRAIRRTRSAQLRAERARELLSQPPRSLERRGSFPMLSKELIEQSQVNTSYGDPLGCRSLPNLTDGSYEALMLSQGANPDRDDLYKWAYSVWWDRWFPEVLKECREAVAELSSGGGVSATTTPHRQKPKVQRKQSESVPPEDTPVVAEKDYTDMVLELEDLSPVSSDPLVCESIEREVSRLGETLEQCGEEEMRAVHYCRRGGLLRKLGRLKESLADLNRALSLKPTLSDVYWHRHLIHLVTGDRKSALEDLSLLLKLNKKHFGAFRSRAVLLEKKGDLSSAVYNMSQAIALQPNDPESYFARAEIYEKRGEVESALSDYARVSELDPTNTEALSRPAMHKFNKGMWAASTQHFAALLTQDPNNTVARIYRAKAHYNIGQYVEALQDLSAAIHLEPNGAQAFYHRGCLLRESQPKQALRDFSVSLLLDDSVANVSAFIHRGVLYTQLKCFDEALSDFESAVRLNRSLPSPHVCAGLVHMLHKNNVIRAIRCFSTAIFVDPTCIRAYLCRADAYQRDAKFKLAILDYARAIHMEPNNPVYYLCKGELYLRLGELELASLHISIAAKLHSGFDRNKAQRALVDSFLGNYDQAITSLRGLPKTPQIYSLMGKIQFKAKDFKGSAESLKQAIYLAERALKPSHLVTHIDSRGDIDKSGPKKKVDSSKMNDLHFACGQSLVESGSLKEAVVEFSKVLHIVPNHAQAYYERGVAKLMDDNPKGMLDLNKSLALNPKLTQSYLARAAYYGKTGRYSKAILNCNEAIRLEPASVRAYMCRGALKFHSQMYHSAVEDFSTAIRLDPRHASLAHFNRALCYQALGKPQMALSEYSVVFLLADSPMFKVLVNRALLYLELGDWANGLLDFIMAGKVFKDNPAILQAIGYCYHRLGSLESAIEAYTEAINLDPTFLGAYIGRGNAYMDYCSEEGNSKSRLDYQQALELEPGNLLARVNLALLLQAEGRFQKAWNELTRVLQTDQWCVPAREARAVISLQMNNLFGALLDINAAIQVHKSALLLTNRGVIHQFMGDVVSAMTDYSEAVKVDPVYSLAHFNMGNILFQQRHFKQAVECYTKAMSEKSNIDSVLLNRAITFVMLRDSQSAIDDFSAAIEANPYSAHAYFNRGNLYHSLGDHEKAEEDYKQALELQPQDWLTMYYYGETMGKLSRDQSAHDMYNKAAETEHP